VVVERVVRTVVAVVDLRQTAVDVVEITAGHTRAVAPAAAAATLNADRIGTVVAPNTVASTHQTSRTRWISRVWTNLTAPAQLEPTDAGLHQWCDVEYYR